MSIEIQGSRALVTGANRGIGRSIVEALLGAGAARVYAAVRRPDSAKPLVDKHGERVVPVELDLTRPQTITAAAERADDVNIVVNNGGVLKTAAPLSPGAIDALRVEIDVNVAGLVRVAQAFAPVLQANGGGAFVQLNSVASLRTFASFTTYCASKAASYSITQGLREVLAERGTLVVSVHPGPIDTDMASKAGMEETDPPSVVADAILDALRDGTFHVFPDRMAREIWEAYQGFAKAMIEPATAEA